MLIVESLSANVTPVRHRPSIGQVLSFGAFSVGMTVQIKSAITMAAIFNSPTSQWSRQLGPSVQNNTAPRAAAAGKTGVVATVDPGDSTVQVQVDGKKSW